MSKPETLDEPHSGLSAAQMLKGLLGLVGFSVVWFLIAGRLTWWQGWALLLTCVAYISILVWRLSKANPDLVRERNSPAEVAEAWDRVVMGVYTAFLVVLWVVSALDSGRYAWSTVPVVLQLLGWLLLVGAGAMIWHVMMMNAYLSSWARIQEDRGQVVIQEGMYRYIRHPMYLGIMTAFLGIPLALNSWWALIPSVIIVGIFIYRTKREDEMLKDGLNGYAEYSLKVKYRLLPGFW